MLHVHVNVQAAFLCPCPCPCVRVSVRVRVRVRVGVHVRVRMYKCRNAGLSCIRSVRYRNDKTNDAGTDPARTKPTQSGIFWVQYRTEIMDAGMPMPPLVSSMPMPSYADYQI
jgi:hypothetical protein